MNREPQDFVLQRSSTAEQVAQRLLTMILNGDLKPGQPLREGQLSALLGISRNSIREGVRLLEQSRLVTYEMHRGTIVSEPSVEQLHDLYMARKVLETSAVRDRIRDEDIENLREAFRGLDEASRGTRASEIVAADLAFHRVIVGFHENQRLRDFFAHMSTEMSYYFTVLASVDEQYKRAEEVIAKEHLAIFLAIEAKDTKLSSQLLGEHIDRNRERLEEILRAKIDSGDPSRNVI